MPDRLCLEFKCAFNWMAQFDEKGIPGCPKSPYDLSACDGKDLPYRTPATRPLPTTITLPFVSPDKGAPTKGRYLFPDDVSEYSLAEDGIVLFGDDIALQTPSIVPDSVEGPAIVPESFAETVGSDDNVVEDFGWVPQDDASEAAVVLENDE